MDKVNNNQEEVSSVKQSDRHSQSKLKGNARNENSVTEMKNAFDELVSRLGKAEERIAEIEIR